MGEQATWLSAVSAFDRSSSPSVQPRAELLTPPFFSLLRLIAFIIANIPYPGNHVYRVDDWGGWNKGRDGTRPGISSGRTYFR